MIDVNWDLAPEGAIGVAQRGKQLAFIDNGSNIFLDDHWGISMGWELVAKRPTFAESITKKPQPEKTVADVVEWATTGWLHDDCDVIVFSPKHGKHGLVYSKSERPLECKEYLVCTRAEFEAYVKEQEGENWTHTYNELKCRTLINEPDREGYIVIVNELNEYYCVDDEELKPIKPTISASGMMQRIAYRAISIDDDDEFGAKVRAWLDEYDII